MKTNASGLTRAQTHIQSRFSFLQASLKVELIQHLTRSIDCLLAWFDENLDIAKVEEYIQQQQYTYPTSPRFWTGSLPGVADGQARSAS